MHLASPSFVDTASFPARHEVCPEHAARTLEGRAEDGVGDTPSLIRSRHPPKALPERTLAWFVSQIGTQGSAARPSFYSCRQPIASEVDGGRCRLERQAVLSIRMQLRRKQQLMMNNNTTHPSSCFQQTALDAGPGPAAARSTSASSSTDLIYRWMKLACFYALYFATRLSCHVACAVFTVIHAIDHRIRPCFCSQSTSHPPAQPYGSRGWHGNPL